MTSITKLPTTPGSIVTFTDWADKNKTEKFTYVTTLLAGEITNGEVKGQVWGDAYTDPDGADTFTEERILAGNPHLVYEAVVNHDFAAFDVATPEERFGQVVVFETDEEEFVHFDNGVEHVIWEKATATFAPGILDPMTGKLTEGFWVTGYGATYTLELILEREWKVIAKGL